MQSDSTFPPAPVAAPAAAAPPAPMPSAVDPMLAKQRAMALATVTMPAIAVVVALAWILVAPVPPFYFALWAAMHLVNAVGISVGFHRLAAHSSFKCGPWTTRALLIMGSTAAQGPVVHWAGNHRRHHRHTDREGDLHSPLCDETGRPFESALAGWWHAHVAWLFRAAQVNPARFTLDLLRDADVMFVHRHYTKWVLLGIVLPGLVAVAVHPTWTSFALGCLFGGFVRIFAVQHLVWSINSVTHLVGRRPYATPDRSTNLLSLALVTGGESWHNNHHAFPFSARLGLEWWELDPGWWALVGLRAVGLARDLKQPTAEHKASKRQEAAPG